MSDTANSILTALPAGQAVFLEVFTQDPVTLKQTAHRIAITLGVAGSGGTNSVNLAGQPVLMNGQPLTLGG